MTCKWSRNILGVPPKNFRKISHTELEIFPYLSNFSKKVSQLTDWLTYKNSEWFRTSVQRPKECLQKVSFSSIKREQRYNKFKLDVYKTHTGHRPGSRGGPKSIYMIAETKKIFFFTKHTFYRPQFIELSCLFGAPGK